MSDGTWKTLLRKILEVLGIVTGEDKRLSAELYLRCSLTNNVRVPGKWADY